MKALLALLLVIPAFAATGQNTFKAIIKDGKSHEPLPGATVFVEGTAIGAGAGPDGVVELDNVPDGTHILVFRMVGYERVRRSFTFPAASSEPVVVLLTPREKELDEVIVSTTRSSRTIADEPTRMEVVSGEELDEKSSMKPGDIRMLLNESTGIHVQQTSATTANAGIRIQGLDGKYTQILKDGFPLYSGFAGGLSIMQIPPLDLQQVEVIKGSSSTLYGGGAIAGLINLISRTPDDEPELSFHINGTSAGGLDLSGFHSRQFNGVGLTVFAARNSNTPYDPADIDLTAIPKFERYTLNPRVFLDLGDRSRLIVGANVSFEDRLGGDIHYIRNGGDSIHSYFEKNRSRRIASQLSFDHAFDEHIRFVFKNSVGFFDRTLDMPGYAFEGNQRSTFSEATIAVRDDEDLEWIVGASVVTEQFDETQRGFSTLRDYSQTVFGGFVQNTWNAAGIVSVETGLRVDRANEYGSFVLPRISALFRLASDLSTRIGGGLGYKLPTIFTEDAEVIQFRNILPINRVTAERSIGGNVDLNYRGVLSEEMTFSINQLFFYTRVNQPLLLMPVVGGDLAFANAIGRIDTRGLETNIKLAYDDIKLFLGYTLTDVRRHFGGTRLDVPLTPKHRLNTVLIYEMHDSWRAGLEAYYFSKQSLTDGTTGRSYWICGFMAEKMWEGISLYINFENFLDTRQTRFGRIYTGTITQPQFKDIYAPVDGFVVNGGVKVRL
jgi:outer membrane receptor for ferrienterochelin and colicins